MIFSSLAPLRGTGRKYLPPADVTFPIAELNFWEAGGPVNRFVVEPKDGLQEEG